MNEIDWDELRAEDEAKRLADRKLFAEVLRWARNNGYGRARQYESGQFVGWSWKGPYQKLLLDPSGDTTIYYGRGFISPDTVREAVDVLCALEILPCEWSSCYRAGRESAYTEDERRTVWRTRFGDIAVWCSGSDHDETYCLKQCRAGHPDAWIEHRRTGATDWSRVDAGS